jgi:general secretion pathway protein D
VKVFAIVLLLALASPLFGDSEASRLARKARKAEVSENFAEAFLLYSQASTMEPGNKRYRAKANLLNAKAAGLAKSDALPLLDADPGPDLSEVFDDASGIKLQPPAELKPREGRFDINVDGDYKVLFEQIANLYRLQCIFDSDYDAGKKMHFSFGQADYRDALRGLSAVTNSFVVPVSDKVFLVARDDPQKRKDLEQAMSVTVPIPQNVTSQELVEIAQAVRQASGVEKMAWDNKTGSVVMRDRVSRVVPAELLFRNLFAHRPQVMIDLQLIQLTKSDIINYGINLPNLFNVVFTGATGSTTSGTSTSGSTDSFPFGSLSYIFTALGSSSGSSLAQAMVRGLFPTSLSVFTISIGAANALVNFSNSLGKTLITENLRSVDSQPATFHYGTRYPILTGSYSAGTTVGSQYTPYPSFKFEDLGVTLKVTPHIHGMDSVTLDVESDFKLLSGSSNNGNPIISTRTMKTTIGLNEDEWAVVAGLQQDTNTRSVAGTAGLASTPILSQIFSQHMKEKDKSEILILMRPHLISLPADQNVPKDVWVGSETRPYTPL